MEKQELVSLSWRLSKAPVGFGQGLNNERCDNFGAHPILSWRCSRRFAPLSLAESELKGERFCDAIDIIKNATEELKILLQNGFQKCFQHIYRRLQKCIFAHGN
jgi:hypothetical protein